MPAQAHSDQRTAEGRVQPKRRVERDAEDSTAVTARALAAQFNLVPEKVAIEVNRRLLRADKYDAPLQAGDQVEIVTFVGGG